MIWQQDRILRRPKSGICQAKKKNQDKIKGTNEDQWEDEEHDKDFSIRVKDGRCRKLFQCLNLKYCMLGENIIRGFGLLYPSFQ